MFRVYMSDLLFSKEKTMKNKGNSMLWPIPSPGNPSEKLRKTIILKLFGALERLWSVWGMSGLLPPPSPECARAVQPGQTHCKTNREPNETRE